MEIRFRVSGKTGTRLLSAPRRYQIIRIDALHHSGPKWDACTLRGSAHAIQIALLRKETQIQKLVVNFTQKCLPDSGKTERNSPAIPGASAKRPDRCPTPPLGELGCSPFASSAEAERSVTIAFANESSGIHGNLAFTLTWCAYRHSETFLLNHTQIHPLLGPLSLWYIAANENCHRIRKLLFFRQSSGEIPPPLFLTF